METAALPPRVFALPPGEGRFPDKGKPDGTHNLARVRFKEVIHFPPLSTISKRKYMDSAPLCQGILEINF